MSAQISSISSFGYRVFRLKKLILDAIFPELCVQCQRYLDSHEPGICEACWQKVHGFQGEFCVTCGNPTHQLGPTNRCPDCQSRRNLFRQATSLGYFEPPLDSLIHRMKYGEGRYWHRRHEAYWIARFFARRMADILPHRTWIARSTRIMPIPLHPDKQAQRGFNQSTLLAAALSEFSGIPLDTTSLVRVINTKSQAQLSAAERHENMKDAFAVEDTAQNLKNEKILLIDDVLTTGATVNAGAEKLIAHGVKHVCVMTIARAGKTTDSLSQVDNSAVSIA